MNAAAEALNVKFPPILKLIGGWNAREEQTASDITGWSIPYQGSLAGQRKKTELGWGTTNILINAASDYYFLAFAEAALKRKKEVYRLDYPATRTFIDKGMSDSLIDFIIFQFTHKLLTRAGATLGENIAKQLDVLKAEALNESEDGQNPLSDSSVIDFLSFLEYFPGISVPTITLSQEGEVLADWDNGAQQKISVRFLSGRAVTYVVLGSDAYVPGLKSVDSGKKSLGNLRDMFLVHPNTNWLMDSDGRRE